MIGMMAMDFSRLRITVICACRVFLGWLLMSTTTADSFRPLMISTHLPDNLTTTICSSSKPIPFDLTLLLMMLLTSLLTRWWLLMALLELLVYRLLRCSIHGGMMRQPNIPLL